MQCINMDYDKLIYMLEYLNSERILYANSESYLLVEKIKRIKKEVKKRDIHKLLNHFLIRFGRKRIETSVANFNLPCEMQQKLARKGKDNIRVAIYTCVVGGYDAPRAPLYKFPNCDYFLFSDISKCEGWNVMGIDNQISILNDNVLINRYFKFHPHEYFEKDYDYCIYLDGNITPISDLSVLTELVNEDIGIAFHRHCSRNTLQDEVIACINLGKGNADELQKQLKRYLSEGMPNDYGLVEGNVIVCDLHNENAKRMYGECWDELLKSNGGRDQLVWPYIFWKNQMDIDKVSTLGFNVWRNPKLSFSKHNVN